MRRGERYRCGKCGVDGGITKLCDPLCKEARDANGNAPPKPFSQTFEWLGGDPLQAGAMLLRSAFRLTVFLRRSRRRRQLRHLFEAAGEPTSIADTEEGLVVIEGRVELIDPVVSPEGDEVAAFIRNEVQVVRAKRQARVERVTVRRASGRFLIRDRTSAAMVDDDWLLLLDAEGNEVDAGHELGGLTLVDEQSVRVVGYCRPSATWVPSELSSFRGHAKGLEMVGGTGRPVCVMPIDR